MMMTSEGQSAASALRKISWLVLLVGGVLGATILYAGFAVEEPWQYQGWTITEDWMSIGLGFLGAAVVAVLFGALWAILRGLAALAARA